MLTSTKIKSKISSDENDCRKKKQIGLKSFTMPSALNNFDWENRIDNCILCRDIDFLKHYYITENSFLFEVFASNIQRTLPNGIKYPFTKAEKFLFGLFAS